MAFVFVDANIYLRFFEEDMRKYHNLIGSLQGLGDRLFIPERVANEVRRNKFRVAHDAMQSKIKDAALQLDEFDALGAAQLPAHLDESNNGEVARLNKDLADLRKCATALRPRLTACRNQLAQRVASSEDPTSRTLEELFKAVRSATAEQMNRAKMRADCGDPPGKGGSSIGDQLCWEQVMDAYAATLGPLCIVTSDGDYVHKVGKELMLNCLLASEFRAKHPAGEVHVFDSLMNAMNFLKTLPENSALEVPTGADAEEILEEEIISGALNATTPGIVASGTATVTRRAPIDLIRALAAIQSEKDPKESTLHYLMRDEQYTTYAAALRFAMQKLAERAATKDPP